ncbi:MAG: hypothetical protein HFG69_15625 [Hungatella sp.]|nr:hypothetical protein [Hungatella sp.]
MNGNLRVGHHITGNNNTVGEIFLTQTSLNDLIAEQTERLLRIDRTNLKKHFKLFDGRRDIDEVFNDGNYKIWRSDLQQKSIINERGIIGACFDIIIKQKILLVVGEYGQGKTILTKMIQSHYIKLNMYTLFFNARDLIGILKEGHFENIWFDLCDGSNYPLYVFIDGIDELIFDNLIEDLIHSILSVIKMTENIYFIINSRIYLKIKLNNLIIKVEDFFSEQYYYNLEEESFCYIKMENFKKEQINALFDKLNNTHVYEKNLTIATIKGSYRHFINACKIPLFAYVIGNYYYKNDFRLVEKVSEMYNSFVSETIRGKFLLEAKGAIGIKNFEQEYEKLLKVLATNMLKSSPDSVDYQGDKGLIDFNSTTFAFHAKLSDLANEARKIYSDYNSKFHENKNADFINCYFFNMSGENKRDVVFSFTDDNTMCFLASKYAVDKMQYFMEEIYNISKDNERFKDIIDFFDGLCLHAIAIDFLIENIEIELQNNEIRKINLIENLKQFLQILFEDNFNGRYFFDKILGKIIIRIIFMKFYDGSYSLIEDNHFFKSFDILCKNAKAMELNGSHSREIEKHRYLTERYFMNCIFNDACFRRINLKFYNFQNSILNNCKFEQCKFYKNNWLHTQIKGNTKFDLCNFNDVNFEFELEGTLVIHDSIILNCELNDVIIGNNVIVFDNCRIANLGIRKLANEKRIRVLFKNSNIRNVAIYGYKITIGIVKSIFENEERIKIKNWSDVAIYIDDKTQVGFENDINSKYYYMENKDIMLEKSKGIDWRKL